ncbi:MAG: DNA cytosine methyltransferase, partial [Clostridia bacterium]|nr:DNA cytosine methyltransferase [Clostridia bacterium]
MDDKSFEFRALSLFSSAGVAETYFERHGINVRVASELLHERAVFYRHLYPNTTMIEGDITDKNTFNNVITTAKKERCNFIIATPPCQGMSTAGLQKKDDPRNRLIIEVVKAIHALKPDFVIIENVPEILQTKIEIEGEWV